MALAGPLYKLATHEVDIEVVTFYSCFAALLGASVLLISMQLFNYEWKRLFPLVILSLLYTTAMLCFAGASKNENPAIVSLLSRTNIIFSFLISFFVFKEKFNFKIGLALLMIVLGTIFLLSTKSGIAISLELALVLYYALAFSVHNGILKNIKSTEFPLVLFFQNLIACISIFIFSFNKENFFYISSDSLGLSMAAGFLSSFLGFIFYQRGLNLSSLSEVTVVRSLSPIMALIVTYPFFPIVFDQFKATGIILILLGTVMFHLWKKADSEKPRIEGYYKYSNEKKVASTVLNKVLKKNYPSVLDVGSGDGTLTQYFADRTDNLHLCEINAFYENKLKNRFPKACIEIDDIWNVKLKRYDLIHFSQGLYYHKKEKWQSLIDHLMSSLSEDGELLLVMNNDTGDWWKAVQSVWSTKPQSLKFYYEPFSHFLKELKNKYHTYEESFSYEVKFPSVEARNKFIREACVPIHHEDFEAKELLNQYIQQLPSGLLSLKYHSCLVSIKKSNRYFQSSFSTDS